MQCFAQKKSLNVLHLIITEDFDARVVKWTISIYRHTADNKSAYIEERICLGMLCTDVNYVYPTPCEKEMDYGIFYMKWQTRCLVIDYMSNLGVWVSVNPAYSSILVTNAQKTPNPLLSFCGSPPVHWPLSS